MSRILKGVGKPVAFLIIGIYLFVCATEITMERPGNNSMYNAWFSDEKNKLDAIYIGASPTFTSLIPPDAWEKYGISLGILANNSQPFVGAKEFLEYAEKKQPNAVYLISINGVYDEEGLGVNYIHASTDYFPASFEKIRLINRLSDSFALSWEERVELLFPLIRYHSRWSQLSASDFHNSLNQYKGGYFENLFLNNTEDFANIYVGTNECAPLPDFTQEALTELLQHCKEKDIRVVFVLSAQYPSEQKMEWLNTIMEQVRAYGFPVINELNGYDSMGLDSHKDFLDKNHTNIHGALKITDYLSEYLIDNYHFSDKRGDLEYASWDEAYDKYKQTITPCLTDEELKQLP